VPGQPDDPDIVAEVPPAELRPDTELPVSSSTSASSSRSRKPCPVMLPLVGRVSRYFAEAYLAVLRANSALVPPTTMARW